MTIIQGKATTQFKNLNITGTFFLNGAETSLVSPSNTKVINLESQFPEQDGTTITLEAGINYFIGAAITTAKRFIVEPGASITSNNIFTPVLTYSGTGVMFTGDNASFTIRDIAVSAPNSTKYFSWPETTPLSSIISMTGLTLIGGTAFGDFGDIAAIAFSLCNATSLSGSGGITLTGTNNILFSVERVALISSSATFKGIDLGSAVITTIDINNLVVVAPSGAFGISGLANNGNIPSGVLGKIANCNFTGGMTGTGLENITKDDVRWTFRDNNTIPDTNPDSLLSLASSTTDTTIGTQGVAVKVAGTFTVERESHFTGDTTGKTIYNGERNLAAPVDIQVTMEPASGNNKDLSVYLAVDGTVVAATKRTIRADNNNPKGLTIPWQIDFTENNFVEIFVANETDTTNITVTDASLRIR